MTVGDSTPPPYGSGSIAVYDYSQNLYTATYSPSSFVIEVGSCSYYFGGPKMNTVSGNGLYKMVFERTSGSSCPADGTTGGCFESYWVTSSANGVLAFADTSSSACPAFFAVTNEGSNDNKGTFTIAGVALQGTTSWVPEGYSGSYSAAKETLTISTPDCAVTYGLDPAAKAVSFAFPAEASPPLPGSATLDFIGASDASCPSSCFASGLNAAWDVTGEQRGGANRLFAESHGSVFRGVHLTRASNFIVSRFRFAAAISVCVRWYRFDGILASGPCPGVSNRL